MQVPSPSVRDLARRLLDREAAGPSPAGGHESERVCEKLRVLLTRFAGAEGFLALMRRSLALAREEVPALQKLILKPDGCFVGFEEALDGDGNEAGTALTAHFLWLLFTFVGEPIGLRLIREEWPDVTIDD